MSGTLSACSARSDATRTSVAGSFFSCASSVGTASAISRRPAASASATFIAGSRSPPAAGSIKRRTAARAALPSRACWPSRAEVVTVHPIERRRRRPDAEHRDGFDAQARSAAGVGGKRRDALGGLVAAGAQVGADRPAQERFALEARLLQHRRQRRHRRLDPAVVVDGSRRVGRRCARRRRRGSAPRRRECMRRRAVTAASRTASRLVLRQRFEGRRIADGGERHAAGVPQVDVLVGVLREQPDERRLRRLERDAAQRFGGEELDARRGILEQRDKACRRRPHA